MCFYERSVIEVSSTVMLNHVKSSRGSSVTSFFVIAFLLLYALNCFLLSLCLSKKIKKTLKNIVEGMERVKVGEEQVHLDFKAEWEFKQIQDSFNAMIQKLEVQKQEKIRMEKQKNQMFLELSHDINTPISTIKSYATALESGLVSEDKKDAYYHIIDLKAGRVSELAKNMFSMLKMDNPDYELQLKKCDMCEVLRKICGEYYEEINEKGFEFIIEIPEKLCYVIMDEKLFSRAIANLFINAIKYNKTGKKIMLSMKKKEKGIWIDVIDDGELLDRELRTTLFDAFTRGDKARKSDGGIGLGLYIVKVIVEKHDGVVEYQSTEEGNCFQISMGNNSSI